MSRSLYLSVAVVIALGACSADQGPESNSFAGCYDGSCVDAPVRVPGVPALSSLSALTSHTCGLTLTGEAWCWGDNSMGQLGDSLSEPRVAPVRVAGNLQFSAISVGSLFTCGVTLGRTVHCWGIGATGQLGQPAPDRCGPNQVACAKNPLPLAARAFTAIATGIRHACGIDASGAAHCWGFNFLGETGSAAYGTTLAGPAQVPGSNVFAVTGAGDSFTCALSTTARAFCWGSGNRGELGRPVAACNTVAGFVNVCSADPVSVNTSATFTSLSVGTSHVCALTSSGTAQCWGDNGQGQLGTGTFENRTTPVVAQNGMTFTTINASGGTTCGTPTAGPSVCWGLNLFGKLGVGSRIDLSTTPLPIAGGRRYAAFAGGQTYVCGLTSDGTAYCWGSGREGQLGTGRLLP